MDVSCQIEEYFENWRDWFLLEKDKEKGLLKLFVNGEKVLEKKVLSHFSLLRCQLKIINFTGIIHSAGYEFNSSSLNHGRTHPFSSFGTVRSTTISITYNIRK